MINQKFFKSQGPFTVKEIADKLGIDLPQGTDLNKQIHDVAPLHLATSNDISFLDNSKYKHDLKTTKAGLCLLSQEFAHFVPQDTIPLITKTPYQAYAIIATELYPFEVSTGEINPTAIIDPSAKIGKNAQIEHGVIIGKNVVIGDNAIIKAYVIINDNVEFGDNVSIGSHSVIQYAMIGDNCIIHPSVSIGQDGFGFALAPNGHLKIPQLGIVEIGNNVEIGAGTKIDRGTNNSTKIGNGTKIDNLVQIAHNVEIGENSIIVAQVGIAGSCSVGNFSLIGGQVGIVGHTHVGDGVQVAAQTGVMSNIPDGSIIFGTPAQPKTQYFRQLAKIKRLTERKK